MLYTTDIPVSPAVSNLVFADDTALLSTASDLAAVTHPSTPNSSRSHPRVGWFLENLY